MNEYLESLRMEAAAGDARAAQRLAEVEAYQEKQRQTSQRHASKLREEGVDVNYLENEVGGIAFNMPTDRKDPPQRSKEDMASSSNRDRIRRIRRKAQQRKGQSGERPRDAYLQQQDRMHGAIAKGANTVHLFIGTALSFLRTFFQRSMLSVVGMLILLVGMALAAEAYCISSGSLPGPIIPKPGVGFGDASANIQALQYFGAWEWFWVISGSAIAIVVQVLQWASVKFIQARARVASGGGALALKGFGLIVFVIFCGALWWQDLSIVSSLYLAGGFSLAGLLVWFWAAFPSEISESIFALQRSLSEE